MGAGVLGVDGPNVDRPDSHVLAHAKAYQVLETEASKRSRGAPSRKEDTCAVAESTETGRIVVVEVKVGHDDHVRATDPLPHRRVQFGEPPQVDDAIAKDRVRQDGESVELDQQRRVADVGDAEDALTQSCAW